MPGSATTAFRGTPSLQMLSPTISFKPTAPDREPSAEELKWMRLAIEQAQEGAQEGGQTQFWNPPLLPHITHIMSGIPIGAALVWHTYGIRL
jgi:hypothetical protein